jgi:transglutaminase/protease-like cytokinesis protein 3
MKHVICSLVVLWLIVSAQGQTAKKGTVLKPLPAVTTIAIPDSVTTSTRNLAAYLMQKTSNKKELLQSLYGWIATHISYDVINTYKPDYYKDTADAIAKTIQTRTAVCQGYASLFMDVCRQAQLPAWLIGGYTLVNGKVDNASHAWVAVQVEGKWYMIDPTWGAGYVNNNKFTAKLSWKYFLVSPGVFIKDHVPFDPMFQLLDHPYRHDEIRDNRLADAAARPVFVYNDSLYVFAGLSEIEQQENMVARIMQYNITNQLISVEVNYLHNVISAGRHNNEVLQQNKLVNKVNAGNSMYNEAVNQFNGYVQFKNNQFSPNKPDAEIRVWIDGIAEKLIATEGLLAEIKVNDVAISRNVQEIKTATADLQLRVKEEQAFVTKYIKTARLFRKALFKKLVF